MAKPILFATALLGVCATASPLIKKDNDACFNATIRKEYLLQVKTYEPNNPYVSEANNVNQVRVNIADPTNQDQNAIVCSDARWNSTQRSFPTEYLSCSDPTLSWKLTSHTDQKTLNLIVKQTFVQGPFSETILASYDGTEGKLRGSCTEKGCSAWFMFVSSNSSFHTASRETITHTLFRRANRGTRRCTTSRRMVHHRPPSLSNALQTLYPPSPTGLSDTPPLAPKTPPTRLPLSTAKSASTS